MINLRHPGYRGSNHRPDVRTNGLVDVHFAVCRRAGKASLLVHAKQYKQGAGLVKVVDKEWDY
eukprot:gene9755-5865_t